MAVTRWVADSVDPCSTPGCTGTVRYLVYGVEYDRHGFIADEDVTGICKDCHLEAGKNEALSRVNLPLGVGGEDCAQLGCGAELCNYPACKQPPAKTHTIASRARMGGKMTQLREALQEFVIRDGETVVLVGPGRPPVTLIDGGVTASGAVPPPVDPSLVGPDRGE